jgi:hypothetical protein
MSWPLRLRRLPIALTAAAVLTAGVACGDARPDESTAVGGGLPPGFPPDFPVPGDAVIESSLVDSVNHRSEVSMTMRTDLVSAVQFFQVGLVNEGYVVGRSEGGAEMWLIEFARGELRGGIEMDHGGGVTTVLVRINAS